MINKVPSLANLIKHLQQIPYVASKNLHRVATYFLSVEYQKIEQLCFALLQARAHVVMCNICCVWMEKEQLCVYCSDHKRDQSIVCVVETWQDLIMIEKTEGYSGLYHVLGGAICPLDGISSEDLFIIPLLDRAQSGTVREIILATNQTPEGEATAAFIARKLKNCDVKISCLARGIPVGSSLEYIDKLTIYKALSERRPF